MTVVSNIAPEHVPGRVHQHGTNGPEVFQFGPYRLTKSQRLLEREGVVVALGARALDVLITLVDRFGETVSAAELLAAVWPGLTVSEAALRVHISAVRKALGHGQAGRPYISNIPGRGYCFVAPVSAAQQTHIAEQTSGPAADNGLPPVLERMVGREQVVSAITTQIANNRAVTIIGPGGIGKTTVAVAIAHELIPQFAGQVYFLDLGTLQDPVLVASAIATVLQCLPAEDPLLALTDFLRDKRVLLVLDCCEHLIDAVASHVETILRAASEVHVLATSREPLAIDAERIHRLEPLQFPPVEADLGVADAMLFPAIQVFVERVGANLNGFELRDKDVAAVAGICRKVDGIALAIELAAARVGVFGLAEVEALLDDQIALIWRGRRTAPPRQQTLNATLEWSHGLLNDMERRVLRRLSVFAGYFDLESAQSIAGSIDLNPELVANILASLISKSLVLSQIEGNSASFRLLHITREYAIAKLVQSGEADECFNRHARYFLKILGGEATRVVDLTRPRANPTRLDLVSNVRAALEWTFSANGDPTLGISIVIASTAMFLAMSIGDEFERWNELAIEHLSETQRGTRLEMLLQASRGMGLRWSHRDPLRAAFARSLEIAEQLGERAEQLQLLHYYYVAESSKGYTERALQLAKANLSLVMMDGDPVQIAIANSGLGVIYHVIGDAENARLHAQSALDAQLTLTPAQLSCIDEHTFAQARYVMAKNLWFRGFPVKAMAAARAILEKSNDANTFYWQNAVIWTNHIFLWSGDLETFRNLAIRLEETRNRADKRAVHPFVAAIRGDFLVHCVDADEGIRFLEAQLRRVSGAHVRAQMLIALATSLMKLGRYAEALDAVDRIMLEEREFGATSWTPEVHRLRGEIIDSAGGGDPAEAESALRTAVALSRSQGSLAWELRAATSLAGLLKSQGRVREARDALSSVYDRFTEGFETCDLVAARQLLVALG